MSEIKSITTEDIKEYIDKLVQECENEIGENPYIVNKIIIDKMYKFLDIKDMLDELENDWVDVKNGLPKAKGYFNLSDTVICEDSGGGCYLGFYDYKEDKFISNEDSVSWLIDIVAWKYIKPRKE